MPVLYHLAETCTGSDRGFHTFAVCLPETDIVQQLINVVVKSLFTFLSAPYLNTIFGEPFNDKRCFVGDSPNTVKHKDKQNIELLLTGKILNDLNLISGFGANLVTRDAFFLLFVYNDPAHLFGKPATCFPLHRNVGDIVIIIIHLLLRGYSVQAAYAVLFCHFGFSFSLCKKGETAVVVNLSSCKSSQV